MTKMGAVFCKKHLPIVWRPEIANLCLLFSNLRKGRLHCIQLIGWPVSPLIFLFQTISSFSFFSATKKIYISSPNIFLFSFSSTKKYIKLLQILSPFLSPQQRNVFSFSKYFLRMNKRFALFTWASLLLTFFYIG